MILNTSQTKESFGQRMLESIDIEFNLNGPKIFMPLAGGLDNPIFSEVNNQFQRVNAPQFLNRFNGNSIKNAFVKNSLNGQFWLSINKGFYETNALKFIKYKNDLSFSDKKLSKTLFNGNFDVLQLNTNSQKLENLNLYTGLILELF